MDLEVEVGKDFKLIVRGAEDDSSITNVDVELVDAYGARWSPTVLTTPEIQRLMRLYRESGGRRVLGSDATPSMRSCDE